VLISQGSPGRVTNTITSILLAFDNPYTQHSDYTFGEFLALFGEPVKTQLLGTFKYPMSNELKEVLFARPDGVIVVTGFDGDLTTDPTKQVKGLLFVEPDPNISSPNAERQDRLYPWMGFMTRHGFWTKTCVRRSMC